MYLRKGIYNLQIKYYETLQFEGNLLTFLPRKYLIIYKMNANDEKTLIVDFFCQI